MMEQSLLLRSFVLLALVGEFWPLCALVLGMFALVERLAVDCAELAGCACGLRCCGECTTLWLCPLCESLAKGSLGCLPLGVTDGDFSGVLLGVVACDCDVVLTCRCPFEFDGFSERVSQE